MAVHDKKYLTRGVMKKTFYEIQKYLRPHPACLQKRHFLKEIRTPCSTVMILTALPPKRLSPASRFSTLFKINFRNCFCGQYHGPAIIMGLAGAVFGRAPSLRPGEGFENERHFICPTHPPFNVWGAPPPITPKKAHAMRGGLGKGRVTRSRGRPMCLPRMRGLFERT